MKMENKILDERKLVEKIRFSCLIAAILTLYFPSMVHLSIAEPDPGGAALINPDQNVSAAIDTPSNTSTSPAVTSTVMPTTTTQDLTYLDVCPDFAPCKHLSSHCLDCRMNHYCTYGSQPSANCTVKSNLRCNGDKTFTRSYYCSYCYQLDPSLYSCSKNTNCNMRSAPRQKYYATCTVRENIMCLGDRTFKKSVLCNWTSGYRWSKALVLSITLGGFGVDRFYLGLWREGIGKLFSFGGLGVWTLVDVILIAAGYIGPYDGSVYIYPWD